MTDKLAAAQALFDGGLLMEAQAAFWSLVRQNPRQPLAWERLGDIALRLNQPAQAFDFYGNAYDFDSGNPGVLLGLGRCLRTLGKPGQAVPHLRKAAVMNPGFKEAHLELALALEQQGELQDAAGAWGNYLKLDEHDSRAMILLADLLMRLMRFEEAESLLHFAILLEPDNPLPLVMQGNVKLARQDKRQAEALYRQALELDAGHAPALFNLGNLAMGRDDFESAQTFFAKAHELAPGDPRLANNLAMAMKEQGRLDEAERILRQAIAVSPDFAEAHWNLATILFLNGNWKEGFKEAEWRWEMDSFTTPRREFGCEAWDGRKLAGETLLIHAEQGLGDAIQFIRYVPLLAGQAKRLVVEADPHLAALFQRSYPMSEIVERGRPLPRADAHLPLMSAPHFLGLLPAKAPYLRADPERVAYWKRRLGSGPWVGLSWQGNPTHHADRRRSLKLAALLPLLDLPGLRLASLQRGAGREQLFQLTDRPLDLGDENDPEIGASFDNTAAMIEAMDIIVSPDTAVAHLGGALGKPVCLLLPHIPDWRWQMTGGTTAWYSSVTLFRQPEPGDWATPIGQIVERLKALHE